jgi:glucose-6-phosphate isomerase
MEAIESGAVKNPDEGRAVTHFGDRLTYAAGAQAADIDGFFEELRAGRVMGRQGDPIDTVLFNGIGGSALGPQFIQLALNGSFWNESSADRRAGLPRIYWLDNTDPAGLADVLDAVNLATTLTVTISKSGGTAETRNNMVAVRDRTAGAGLDFARHAAVVTMKDSELHRTAVEDRFLRVWEMPESIGGRTSITAVVGHVAAAAAGIDFKAFLDGACAMDEWTRASAMEDNPAYQLAAAWYHIGGGRGEKNMVIVPYADRLILLARYLQQLVMESLGKELDRDGNVVNQGLTVYGNKGAADAHAYIQQLQDGPDDFFITFVEILDEVEQHVVDDGLTVGDYLYAGLHGLADALESKGRAVIHLRFDRLHPRSMGMLIALYERAVSAYAELVNINAYHQPGVQAYKTISHGINELNRTVQESIAAHAGTSGTAVEIAATADRADQVRAVEGLLHRFAVNDREFGGVRVRREFRDGQWVFTLVG